MGSLSRPLSRWIHTHFSTFLLSYRTGYTYRPFPKRYRSGDPPHLSTFPPTFINSNKRSWFLSPGTRRGQGRPENSRPSVNKHQSCGNLISESRLILKTSCVMVMFTLSAAEQMLTLASSPREKTLLGNVHEKMFMRRHPFWLILPRPFVWLMFGTLGEKTQMFFLSRGSQGFHVYILYQNLF